MNALSNMNKDSAGKAKLGIKHLASLIDDLLSSIIKEKINKISLANYLARQRKEDVIKEEDAFFRFFERETKHKSELPLEDN